MYTQTQFINEFFDEAERNSRVTGVAPELTIAQGIIESSAKVDGKYMVGASTLAKKYNNYFGAKAGSSWTGKTVTLPTREVINGKSVMVNAKFRVYDSIQESFLDHDKLLLKSWPAIKNYNDPIKQLQVIQSGSKRYATDPNYLQLVSKLIKGVTVAKSGPSEVTNQQAFMLPAIEVTGKQTYYTFAVIMGAAGLYLYSKR